MKKLGLSIIHLLRGLWNDFWMLPIAIILAIWHEGITESFGLFPSLNPEKVGNIIPTLIVWLLILFIVRLFYFFQYKDVYHKSLMRSKNKIWHELSDSQQFLYLRVERWVLIVVLAIVYSAMM